MIGRPVGIDPAAQPSPDKQITHQGFAIAHHHRTGAGSVPGCVHQLGFDAKILQIDFLFKNNVGLCAGIAVLKKPVNEPPCKRIVFHNTVLAMQQMVIIT